jgi:hypothetical protein
MGGELQRVRPRRYDKRTNTAANSTLSSHPQEFHGGSFGVSGTSGA